MSSLFQELRFAVRTLAKSPRFALLAVATLALSIGSTSALFSVVNAVLLKPLPYRDPENLFQFSGAGLQRGRDRLSPGDYLDIKRRAQSFAPLAGYRSLSCELSGNGEPQRLHAADVTADFFEVFGIGARLGRLFDARQDRPGSGRRAVLSHGLWTRRFGSDSSVLGKTIRVDGESVAVVGIAPASFDWPAGTEIWTVSAGPVPAPPMQVPEDPLQNRDLQYIEAIARLAPGVDRRAAQAETAVIAADLERRFVQSNRGRTWRLVVLQEQLVGGIREALAVLLGAVAFVWLVSCANIATLMLARAAGRQREMSIRSALGASRARLVRQLVTEGLVLSLAGGAAGLAAASSGTDLLRRLAPPELPRLSEVSLDGRAALVAIVLSLAAGLLFGLAPALSASRRALAGSLREGSRPTGGARRKSLQSALVVAELALALTLLSGAGLLANSFFRLQRVDPGFLPDGLQSVWLPLPQTRYPDAQRQAAFYTDLVRRLREAPELSGAAAIYPLPLAGRRRLGPGQTRGARTGKGRADRRDHLGVARVFPVSPDFAARGARLRRPRLRRGAADGHRQRRSGSAILAGGRPARPQRADRCGSRCAHRDGDRCRAGHPPAPARGLPVARDLPSDAAVRSARVVGRRARTLRVGAGRRGAAARGAGARSRAPVSRGPPGHARGRRFDRAAALPHVAARRLRGRRAGPGNAGRLRHRQRKRRGAHARVRSSHGHRREPRPGAPDGAARGAVARAGRPRIRAGGRRRADPRPEAASFTASVPPTCRRWPPSRRCCRAPR